MFELLILILLSAVATEAIVEIVTKSDLFSPVMIKLALREDFFSKLLTCPYCFSVWVAGVCALLVVGYLLTQATIILLPILIFSIHRIANIIHCSQDALNAKRNKKSSY